MFFKAFTAALFIVLLCFCIAAPPIFISTLLTHYYGEVVGFVGGCLTIFIMLVLYVAYDMKENGY
jgi:hypothetical protein